MKKSNKKLIVNKESLRVLSERELTVAGGGGYQTIEPSICVGCDTADCCNRDSTPTF